MLSTLRTHQKRILTWFIPPIILVFLIAFGGGSALRNRDREDETNYVAKVNGQVISMREYRTAYDRTYQDLRNSYGDQWDESMIDRFDLPKYVLDSLINQELLYLEAEQAGLEVTDAEVSSFIRENIAGPRGMSVKEFLQMITRNGVDADAFVEQQRKALLVNKMQQIILSNVHVTEQELKEEYKNQQEKVSGVYLAFKPESYLSDITEPSPEMLQHYFEQKKERFRVPDRVKVDYIELNPKDFESLIEISDAQVERYYENHGEEYEVPEKVRVDYINFSPDKFEDRVSLTEEEIREYYESNKSKYMTAPKVRVRYVALDFHDLKQSITPTEEQILQQYQERKEVFKSKEQRTVRWIVKTVPENDPGQMRVEKRQELLDLKKDIEAGDITFAQAAREHSEGQFKESGGLMGTKTMDELMPFGIAEEAFFSLDKGDISDVLSVRGGVALVFVEDINKPQVQPLNQVRDKVMDSIQYEKAREEASERLAALKETLGVHIDPSQVPEDLYFRETRAFARGEDIDDVVGDSDKGTFANAAFGLREEGQISDVVEANRNWYLIELVDKSPAQEMTFEKAREKVVVDQTKQKAMTVATEAAEDTYQRVKNGESYDVLAREMGLDIVDTGFITKEGRVPGIGWNPAEFITAAFSLREGEISNVVRSPAGAHILRFVDREEAHIPELTDNIANAIERTLIKEESIDMAKNLGEGILFRAEREEISLVRSLQQEKDFWLEDMFTEESERQQSPIMDIGFKTSEFFSEVDSPEDIGQAPEFVQTAFNLDATGEQVKGLVTKRMVGLPNEIDAYYIMVLNEKQEAHIPDISEVSEEVKETFMKFQASKLAQAEAEAVYDDLELWLASQREGKPATAEVDLAEFARRQGLSLKQARPFGRKDPIGDIGRNAALAYEAFNTPVGEITEVVEATSPVLQDGEEVDRDIAGYFIFQPKEHAAPDMELYHQTERKNIQNNLSQQRKSAALQDWLNEHEERADIERREELIS